MQVRFLKKSLSTSGVPYSAYSGKDGKHKDIAIAPKQHAPKATNFGQGLEKANLYARINIMEANKPVQNGSATRLEIDFPVSSIYIVNNETTPGIR